MKSLISVYHFSIPGKFHLGTRQFFCQQVLLLFLPMLLSIYLYSVNHIMTMRHDGLEKNNKENVHLINKTKTNH